MFPSRSRLRAKSSSAWKPSASISPTPCRRAAATAARRLRLLSPGASLPEWSKSTGERVMGYMQWGAAAEKIAVKPKLLWPQPKGWTSEQSAAFPVNFLTAYLAYWKAGMTDDAMEPIRWSDNHQRRVLIHAAAGGVGTAAVQMGKILGIETYGTSSSDEKLERVKKLGLDHAINYREVDYEERVKELTKGEGVDAVFEMLGGEHTAKSLRCCRHFGRVIIYGTATGQRASVRCRNHDGQKPERAWALAERAGEGSRADQPLPGRHGAMDRRGQAASRRSATPCRWSRPARRIACCCSAPTTARSCY